MDSICAAGPSLVCPDRTLRRQETMLDIIALAITLAFFAGSIAYVHACDRL
jgi:hypothetical protein